VELQQETEAIAIPDWIGEEVTGDPRYYNANLATVPYDRWE
jgi:CYTH domain-containing protein